MDQEMEVIPPADFKDRKTVLMVFGVLTMCFGGLCAIMVLIVFLTQVFAPRANVPQPPHAMLSVVVIYGGLAAILFALGIGSILARRWARALLLVFSWIWLVTGVFAIAGVAMLVTSPHFKDTLHPPGQPELPAAAAQFMVIIPIAIIGIVFLVIPGIWIYFYSSRHVKATCEARNPLPSWTDRSPLPVLALSLMLGLCVVMMAAFPFIYNSMLPFFGTFLSRIPGTMACVVLIILWGYCAWGLYNLRLQAWWITLVSMCFFCISSIITYSRHDIMESYRLMGYSEMQIMQLQRINTVQGSNMLWIMVISTLFWLGYLLWIRKFFTPRAVLPQAT